MKGFVSASEYERVCQERDGLLAQLQFVRGDNGAQVSEEVLLRAALGLCPGPARVLRRLYLARGRFVPLYALGEALPDWDRVDSNVAQVYVCRIRKVLGPAAVETIRTPEGPAYRLVASERVGSILRQQIVGFTQ